MSKVKGCYFFDRAAARRQSASFPLDGAGGRATRKKQAALRRAAPPSNTKRPSRLLDNPGLGWSSPCPLMPATPDT